LSILVSLFIATELLFGGHNLDTTIKVAFIGNSVQYFNDCPRFMEAISDNRIIQNSCLRPSATLTGILKNGNGMGTIFNTSKALKDEGSFDIGAPDVYTLLLGDETSGYEPPNWDFVVMNDRTYYPAKSYTRSKTKKTLENVYAPILEEIGATPVFIATHAYRVPSEKVAELGNITTYTSLVLEGVKEYAEVLQHYLPSDQTPRIAPVGKAFLRVWEEDPDLWYNLFNIDDYHPSPHGTYLQGCVIYCTLFERPPLKETAIPFHPADLFRNSRVMQPEGWTSGGDYLPKPTYQEAEYLFNVAKRVCKEPLSIEL